MKKMACKICGSTDITADGDTVSCESCGNKYTLPSSKDSNKIHKVKADKSGEVANFLKRAKSFFEDGELEKASDYSNKVLDIDANNLDASLLLAFSKIVDDYSGFISSLKKLKKSVDNEVFLSKMGESIEGALKWFDGANNLNYIVPRLWGLLSLNYGFKKDFNSVCPRSKDILTKANELLQKKYDLSKYIYINDCGRYKPEDFVESFKEIIILLGKNEDLDKDTQKNLVNIIAEFLKDFLPDAYKFFINGLYHNIGAASYPMEQDFEHFSSIHVDASELAKILIEYCKECKNEDKISLYETMAEHYELYAECEITKDGSRRGFNDEKKKEIQEECAKYRQLADVNALGLGENVTETHPNSSKKSSVKQETKDTQIKKIDPDNKDEYICLGIWVAIIIGICVLSFSSGSHKQKSTQIELKNTITEISNDIVNSHKEEQKEEAAVVSENNLKEENNVKEYVCGSTAICDADLIMDSTFHQPITGIVKEYHEYGALSKKSSVVSGSFDGISELYFGDGTIKEKGEYKNGQKNGVFKTYNANGGLETETSFKNDLKDGLTKEFDKNGMVIKSVSYKNGMLVGETKEYYSNGNIKMIYPFENDKLNGIVKKYDENGALIAEVAYENGEKKETRVNENILPKKVEKKAPSKKQVRKGKISEWDIEHYTSFSLPDWTGYAAALTNQIYNECVEKDIVDSNTTWAVSVEKYHYSIQEQDLETIKQEIEKLLKEQSVVKVVQNPDSAKYNLRIFLNKEREGQTYDTEFCVIKVFLYDNGTEEYVSGAGHRFKEGHRL